MKENSGQDGQQPAEEHFLVVGIGASAGGIEALQAFFEQVPAHSGAAYVVILHLSPDHDSQLAQVLQQVTPLPVQKVTAKTRIEPDHIYVVPPDKHLTMDETFIIPSPNIRPEERRAPVDIFFRNLAEVRRRQAVGVILSGTGANGSMGLKHIKEKGGAVFVQNPREAIFNEMPRNAIATGLVDEVLNVAGIPAHILDYCNTLGQAHIAEEPEARAEDEQQALRDIFTQLRLRTGHDFSNYKRATLMRRIERRMAIRSFTQLPAYAAFSTEHPEETQALLKDLLISVTNFFRDKTPFEYLEAEVLPALFESKSAEDQVRIWVAGCATGEEAYTMAILCAERTLGVMDAPKVQIFATDIDEAAIATAREGYYTLNDAADVSSERLARFFNKEGEGYRVRREIRETILFAHHNFLKDPPFSRIDLISCRNVLIYLNRPAQERVMETFHFALRPEGFLMLGTSESVDTASDLFRPFSREQHVFQSRLSVNQRPIVVPESVQPLKLVPLTSLPQANPPAVQAARAPYGDLHIQLLEEYAPPSLIVNADFELAHASPRAGRYLQFSGGEPTQAILKLIREELRSELRNGLYQAAQQGAPVNSLPLRVRTDQGTENIRIQVRPVRNDNGDQKQGLLLVIFEPVASTSEQQEAISYTSDESAARHLEDEVVRLRTQLRASNEQHEFQAEELKAGNEELQAMNEELRSATEELETSKEELQSINEELSTVNQELKVKVEEATMISNNLQNLINSTDIGTIFLDRSFRVVLFTPAVRSIFNLIPADYGRSLSDITSRLEQDTLLDDARMVLERLQLMEREVRTTDGRIFLARLSPYRTEEDRIQGVVISMLDITERKKADEDLRESHRRNTEILESISDAFYAVDADFNFTYVNKKAEELWGRSRDSLIGKHYWTEFPAAVGSESYHRHLVASTEKQAVHYETRSPLIDRWIDVSIYPDVQGGLSCYFRDITERKAAEDLVRASGKRDAYLLRLGDAVRHLSAPADIEAAVTYTAMQHFTADRCYYCEISEDQAIIRRDASKAGLHSVAGVYELSAFPLLKTVIETGHPFVVKNVHTDNTLDEAIRQLCIQLQVISFLDIPVVKAKKTVGVLCIVQSTPRDWDNTEVSLAEETAERTWEAVERARAEEALRGSEARLRVTMETAVDYAIINTDSRGLVEGWSRGAELAFGWTEDEMRGNSTARIFTPEDQAKGAPEKELETAAREGRAPDERWHMRKDGSLFYMSGMTRPIYDTELRGFVKVARDLTEQRQAEEALRVSEERHRVALESAEMAAWDWNIVEDKVGWNAQHFLLLGLPSEDRLLDADFFLQFVHPEDRPAVSRELTRAVDETGIFRMETFRIVRTDGQVRWMSGHGRTVAWQDGKSARMVGVMYDITNRVEALYALHDKQLKLEIAQRAARIGIWGFDLEKNQGIATPEWNELTGYPEPGETFELSIFLNLVHPEDRSRLVTAHNQAVNDRSAIELEFRLQHPVRGLLWLLKRGQYIPAHKRTNAALMGSLIDITERKELEQQKEQFISIASHELRTPVTSTKAYAELLEELFSENGNPQYASLMQKLNTQIDRLTSLINTLLDTTRITEGKLQLYKTRFSIDELIRDTAEIMQRIAGRQRIDLNPGAGTMIEADAERIRQVLVNLIGNAIKYSPGTERIIIRSSADEQQVTISVEDFGIGIAPEMQQQVFGRFFRGTGTNAFAGLGLGLFISASIIEQHGGRIWVNSREGEGALFCFSLPLIVAW